MRIAIMQPYFMPYAGYFRLMEAADLFVIYDCVQFPRRGWVHRNKLTDGRGNKEWLTLPLEKSDRDATRIMDLQFAEHAQDAWSMRMHAFPVFQQSDNVHLLKAVRDLIGTPCDYIIHGLHTVCDMLGISCEFIKSSTLALPAELKNQDRILAIAEHFSAKTYINAPGGRELYEPSAFSARGIDLHFQPDYRGDVTSIVERLLREPANSLAQEIRANL